MKDFKKYYLIPASPEEVYLALTNPAAIQLWTGESAIMSELPQSEFSMWDDSISGKNLEFIPNQKIVQQWYFGEQEDSIVTIKLFPDKHGTSLELRHSNIPDAEYPDMTEGWTSSYMAALIEFFEEKDGFTQK